MPLRQFTTAELVLTQRLHLERPLLALVLLGAGALAVAEGNIFYLALTTVGVLINALALQRRSEVYVPRAAVNVAVLAATVLFLYEFVASVRDVLALLGHYLVLIQLCKLFEQKRNRDYAQMLALSAVLMVASAMMTTGLWFAVVLALYVPVACYVVMVLTLKVALDRQAGSRLSLEDRPLDPHRLAWNVSGSFPRRLLWRTSVLVSAGAAATAAAVFLGMPRGQAGMLAPLPPGADAVGLTGYRDSIDLRAVGRVSQDPSIVMRVQLDRDGVDLGKSGYAAYLRGKAYGRYERGQWQSWNGELAWWQGRVPSYRTWPEGSFIRQRVTMGPALLPAVFAVAPLLTVEAPLGVTVSGAYPDLSAERIGEGPVRYTAWSWAPPLSQPQRAFLAGIRGHAPDRRAEPVSPRIAALAKSWCADLLQDRPTAPARAGGGLTGWIRWRLTPPSEIPTAADTRDLAIAGRIAGRLQSDYAYTLDLSSVDPDADPVEGFLFVRRRGHCEYFASAMTLLCRALGVQARLIGGFLANDYNEAAGGYLVAAGDAHAWCEVYTPSTDWVVFDPTPAGSAGRAGRGPGKLWQAVKYYWSTHVIGYGEEDRQRLFGTFLRVFELGWRGVASFFKQAGSSVAQLVLHGRLEMRLVKGAGVVAAGASLPLAALWLLRRRRRRKLRRLARLPLAAPGFYKRLLKLLRRRGQVPLASQTPREFLFQAQAALPLPADALALLARMLYQVRWGRRALTPQAQAQADSLVDDIAARLKRK